MLVEGLVGPQDWVAFVNSMATEGVMALNSCLYALAECTGRTIHVISGVKGDLYEHDIVPKTVEVN
jgi:hypothetical protein